MPPRRAMAGRLDEIPTPAWATGFGPSIVRRAQRFQDIGVRSTIWADRETMHEMGILEPANSLLTRMGLHGLTSFAHPTYRSPTIQFFSTVELIENADCGEGARGCSISFLIDRTRHVVPIPQLCEIFGFQNDLDKKPMFQDEARELWRSMTSEFYRGDGARSMKLRNPTIRYVARLVANTLFARQDSGKVKINELCLLHRGLEEALNENLDRDTEANNAYMFIEGIIEFRKLAKSSSLLCFGGMLTRIFLALNIDLSAHERVEGSPTMDIAYLSNLKSVIVQNNGRYLHRWTIHGTELKCRLPQPNYSPPTSPGNIKFEVPTSILYTSPPRETQRRAPARGTERESSPFPESSDEEIPDEFTQHPETIPQRPPPPTTEEGMLWASYHEARADLQDRQIGQLRQFTAWLAKKHAKAMTKLREIRAEMRCQRADDVQAPPPGSTHEYGSPSSPARTRNSEEDSGNDSPLHRRRRVD